MVYPQKTQTDETSDFYYVKRRHFMIHLWITTTGLVCGSGKQAWTENGSC